MKKIKVYNISKLIEEKMEGSRLCGLTRGLAIIEGKKRLLVFMDEAVGWIKENITDTITLTLINVSEGNNLYPLQISLKEIMEADYKEMYITEFITRYNSKLRIECNFDEILKAINKIGLNKRDYCIKENN